jgi:hypothetical protein
MLSLVMNESTKASFRALLLLVYEVLARVSFVLLRMIETFESCVRIVAIIFATCSRFRVVVLALFGEIELQIWSPSIVKGLMCVDASVPVVVLRLVSTV